MKMIEIDALIATLNKKPQTKNYMMRVTDIYNVIRSVPVYEVDPKDAVKKQTDE